MLCPNNECHTKYSACRQWPGRGRGGIEREKFGRGGGSGNDWASLEDELHYNVQISVNWYEKQLEPINTQSYIITRLPPALTANH